jgi:hypothetical protein
VHIAYIAPAPGSDPADCAQGAAEAQLDPAYVAQLRSLPKAPTCNPLCAFCMGHVMGLNQFISKLASAARGGLHWLNPLSLGMGLVRFLWAEVYINLMTWFGCWLVEYDGWLCGQSWILMTLLVLPAALGGMLVAFAQHGCKCLPSRNAKLHVQ